MTVDAAIAERLADTIKAADSAGRRRTWRKVTTLLSMFGVYNLTDDVRSRIADALAGAGLVIEPPIADVSRSDTVVLSIAGADPAPLPTPPGSPLSGVTRHTWTGGALRPTTSEPSRERPVFVEVDMSKAVSPELRSRLDEILPTLTAVTIDDLLDPDIKAEFKLLHDGASKRASVAVATRNEGLGMGSGEIARVVLDLSILELAVSDEWLLVVRHAPQTYVNGASAGNPDTMPSEKYLNQLLKKGLASAGSPLDAAMIVLEHAVASFNGLQEELTSWQDTWQLEFAKGATADGSLLLNLQQTLPVVTRHFRSLLHPSVTRWVGASSEATPRAMVLREQVARDLDALRALADANSAALAQLAERRERLTEAAAAERSSQDRNRNETYIRKLTTLAAVVLVPGLVAAIFGANSRINGTWTDLFIMLAAMAVTAGASYLVISKQLKAVSRASRKQSLRFWKQQDGEQLGGAGS